MYFTDLRPIGFNAFHFIFCACVAYISFDYCQCMTTHVFYLFYYLFLTHWIITLDFVEQGSNIFAPTKNETIIVIRSRQIFSIHRHFYVYLSSNACRLNSNESVSIICRRHGRRLARETRENPRFQLFDFRALFKSFYA